VPGLPAGHRAVSVAARIGSAWSRWARATPTRAATSIAALASQRLFDLRRDGSAGTQVMRPGYRGFVRRATLDWPCLDGFPGAELKRGEKAPAVALFRFRPPPARAWRNRWTGVTSRRLNLARPSRHGPTSPVVVGAGAAGTCGTPRPTHQAPVTCRQRREIMSWLDRLVLAAFASVWLLATASPAFAQSDDCHPLAPDVEVGGKDLQPTPGEVEERLAEDGCAPSAAEEAAGREETEEVDQLYRQLETETEQDQEGAAAGN
jgi:hypothetical protein